MMGQSVWKKPLQGLHDPAIDGASAVLEQTAIRHVVGEGVLEGVLEVGEDLSGLSLGLQHVTLLDLVPLRGLEPRLGA
jgi:hypothetical protein